MMKMVKKAVLIVLGLVSINAFAEVKQDKRDLVKNINTIITEVRHLSVSKYPVNCLWHIEKSSMHMQNARIEIFNDDILRVRTHLLSARKSLKNLEFEGRECEKLSRDSEEASYLMSKEIEKIEITM